MLAMNENLMGCMETPHLLAALEAEGHLPPAEKVLAWRLESLIEQETGEEAEARLEKSYESAMEQSEFRAQAIQEILELCEASGGTRRDLVKAIRALVENSYVEL